METLIENAKNFNAHQRQLLVLLFQCPYGEPKRICVFHHIRKMMNYDYIKIVKSFKTDEIIELVSDHSKCLYEKVRDSNLTLIPKNILKIINGIPYLHWTGKGNLDFLTLELIKRKWIRSQKNFTKLFDNKDIYLKVYWNREYKYELAYLLFKLIEEGFICPVNSKGYFRIAERHIIDYSRTIYKNNTLKQISSKINNEPGKYVDIIENVNDVIKAISLKTNRLLKDYSQ